MREAVPRHRLPGSRRYPLAGGLPALTLPDPSPGAPRALRLKADALQAPASALHRDAPVATRDRRPRLLPAHLAEPQVPDRRGLCRGAELCRAQRWEPQAGRRRGSACHGPAAPAFAGRALRPAASRAAWQGGRALGVAGLGNGADLSGQRFVRDRRGLFLKCPTPSP